MRKYCIIFRGENERNYRNYVDSRLNVPNWETNIFNDLRNNGIEYDIVFITYESNILESLKTMIPTKEVILCEKKESSQIKNFHIVDEYMKKKDKYDRFIILRFDVYYKQKITTWNNWNQKHSICLPNKDTTWNQTRFYNDLIFIIDSDRLCDFNKAVEYMLYSTHIDNYPSMPHHIGQYLYMNKIPFHLIYDQLYDGIKNHPLYSMT